MPKIGFVSSRRGLTKAQRIALSNFFEVVQVGEFHHGDGKGGDAQAHDLVSRIGRFEIFIHPSTDIYNRAFKISKWISFPTDYMIRNRIIVGRTDFLVSAPDDVTPMDNSGIWWTMKAALDSEKKVLTFAPNGKVFFRAPGNPSNLPFTL